MYRCDRPCSVRRSVIDKVGMCRARAQWDLFVGESTRIDHLIHLIFFFTQHLNFFCCPVKELRLSYASEESCSADRSYALPKQRRWANYEVAYSQ